MGSSQNFLRSIHFSCCTVSILVTSRMKASPFKMFTVNSWGMAHRIQRMRKNVWKTGFPERKCTKFWVGVMTLMTPWRETYQIPSVANSKNQQNPFKSQSRAGRGDVMDATSQQYRMTDSWVHGQFSASYLNIWVFEATHKAHVTSPLLCQADRQHLQLPAELTEGNGQNERPWPGGPDDHQANNRVSVIVVIICHYYDLIIIIVIYHTHSRDRQYVCKVCHCHYPYSPHYHHHHHHHHHHI